MGSQRRILRRSIPAGEDRLPAELNPVVRRVLLARGVSGPEQLGLRLQDMHAPQSLSGIRAAAELLANAVTGGQRILIVGDFDADGATGTALAVRWLFSHCARWAAGTSISAFPTASSSATA